MASITFDSVRKVYPDGTVAVPDLDLRIDDGEFMAVVGPSGCGKSTALRMTAGLEDISGGRLLIGDDVVNGRSPQDRDIAMVFQDYALYPHMTVRENIGFPLRMMKVAKAEQRARVERAAERLGLGTLLDRRPGKLSGGQRQRVAMGRAIVREPAAFLMDEPLSNLDAKLRVQMRAEVATLQRQLGVTTLYVTHDQVEAMTMGDRVAVMRDGLLQQCAPPQELYDRPANLFVAGFIGSPKMNLFASQLAWDGNGDALLQFGERRLRLSREEVGRRGNLNRQPEGPITVGIRPEALHHAPHALASDVDVLDVVALVVEALGPETLLHFTAPVQPAADSTEPLEPGSHGSDHDGVEDDPSPLAESGSTPMCARLVPPLRVTAGDAVRLRLDLTRLYLFDAAGGALVRDDIDASKVVA